MRYLQHIVVLALAVGAVFLVSGCHFDPFGYAVGYDPDEAPDYFYIRCEGGVLQAYVSDDYPSSYLAGGFGSPFDKTVNSPLNGFPCSKSTENQNRAFSISEAVKNGLLNPNPSHGTQASPSTPSPELIKVFPFLEPLLFKPAFPTSDSGKPPSPCDFTYQAYIVNHLQNTVTAIGLCPLRVVKTISVASNPLQVAITPDGSSALVTSYDGGLIFIDTATNQVKATMDLSNYNPSGIAISPDSTRAYVTHYLDINPALVIIDIPNRKVMGTIPLTHQYPRQVVITPDGSQAWVNYLSDRVVTVIDLLTSSVVTNINISQPVSTGMAFNQTGTEAYLAVYPNQVYVVTTNDLMVKTKLTVGQAPSDVVISPDGRRIFVTAEAEPGMWWIDTSIDQVIVHTVPKSPNGPGSMGLVVFQ